MNYLTLCLRLQFDGPSGQNVLETDIYLLMPWLRNILTNIGLPHPRPANVVKPPSRGGTSDIDMYWDVASTNPVVRNVCNRCEMVEISTLREKFIVRLMVYAYSLGLLVRALRQWLSSTRRFLLPYNARDISSGLSPTVVKQCSPDRTNAAESAGTSSGGSHSQPSELEARLLRIFANAGINVPSPQNLASYIPVLEKHIQTLHFIAERETARRLEAEANLAEEEARHARILLDIKEECREPFVVPALLDAFVALSETVDSVTVTGMNS